MLGVEAIQSRSWCGMLVVEAIQSKTLICSPFTTRLAGSVLIYTDRFIKKHWSLIEHLAEALRLVRLHDRVAGELFLLNHSTLYTPYLTQVLCEPTTGTYIDKSTWEYRHHKNGENPSIGS
jgi:hypothetical protein